MNAETFIYDQPPAHQQLLEELRNFILDTHPAIQELILYKTLFYRYKKPLCYFTVKKDHVILGFVDGHLLDNSHGALKADNKQKYIRHLKFYIGEPINYEILNAVLQEAMMVKDMLEKKKNPKLKIKNK